MRLNSFQLLQSSICLRTLRIEHIVKIPIELSQYLSNEVKTVQTTDWSETSISFWHRHINRIVNFFFNHST